MPTVADRACMDTVKHHASEEAVLDEFVCSIPCVCPSEMIALFTRLRRALEVQCMDMSRPCSLQSEGPTCWIVGFLSNINAHLGDVNLELLEDGPRHFTIRSLEVDREVAHLEEELLMGTILSLYLLKTHRCIQELSLGETALVFDFPNVLAAAVAAAPGLTVVKLSPPRALQPNAISVLSALKERSRIDKLDLLQVFLDDCTSKEVAELLQIGSIGSLTIGQQMLFRPAKRVFKAVNSCASLHSLSIRGTEEFPVKLAELLGKALRQNKTLRSLSVTNVQSTGVIYILEALGEDSALESLSLTRVYGSSERVVSGTVLQPAFTRLKTLQLSLNGIESHSFFCCLADALEEGLCTLTLLHLSDTAVDDRSSARLAKALCNSETLKNVHLEHCGITTEGAKQLALALEQNLNIEQIWLRATPIGKWDASFNLTDKVIGRFVTPWSSHGLHEVTRVLCSGQLALAKLELGWTSDAEAAAVTAVFQALCWYDRLEELHVYSGQLTDCFSDLVNLVRVTRSLRKLTVVPKFCDFETMPFMHALAENQTLTDVSLIQCTLRTNENARALRTLVRRNDQLSSLTLCNHIPGGKAFRSLGLSLAHNYVLVSLNFHDITPYESHYIHVRQVLNRNRCLRNRAIQFLKNEVCDEDHLRAIRLLCNSYSFAKMYAEVANVSFQAAQESILAASFGHCEEK